MVEHDPPLAVRLLVVFHLTADDGDAPISGRALFGDACGGWEYHFSWCALLGLNPLLCLNQGFDDMVGEAEASGFGNGLSVLIDQETFPFFSPIPPPKRLFVPTLANMGCKAGDKRLQNLALPPADSPYCDRLLPLPGLMTRGEGVAPQKRLRGGGVISDMSTSPLFLLAEPRLP